MHPPNFVRPSAPVLRGSSQVARSPALGPGRWSRRSVLVVKTALLGSGRAARIEAAARGTHHHRCLRAAAGEESVPGRLGARRGVCPERDLNSDQAHPGLSLQMTLWLLSGCFRSWPYRFGRVRPGRSRRVCDHFVITKAPLWRSWGTRTPSHDLVYTTPTSYILKGWQST